MPESLEAREERLFNEFIKREAGLPDDHCLTRAAWDARAALAHVELGQREAELEQRWIAVADKLPEIGQFVVAIAYGRVHERTLYRREFSTYDGKRWTWQGLNGIPANHVTYWQPLPSPPKVQP